MTPDKLKANFQKLKNEIKRKPLLYTSDYATTIPESFEKYTKTSSINLIVSLNEMLIEFDWPFPTYIQNDKSANKKMFILLTIIVVSEYMKEKIFFWKDTKIKEKHIKQYLDKFIYRHFSLCKKNIFSSWKNDSIFSDKHYIIDNIHNTYSKGYWYACITSTLPLLDFLCRKYFNVKNLDRDITYIVSMFRQAEISVKDTKPGYIAWEVAKEKGENIQKATSKDLRLVGIALSSFLNFAEIYYKFYRNDSKAMDKINRHAIIHCAANQNIWTKENATKILIFLDLTLSLKPVFTILLNER